MRTIYFMIKGEPSLRELIANMLTLIHFSDEVAFGDWYLFEAYTVIRVYDFDGKPYMLPMFRT